MLKTTLIPYRDFRAFLMRLGYEEKSTASAHVFHRAGADLLVFRCYRDKETVDASDLISTRKFLDLWGLLEAGDFDEFLESADKSA